MYTKPEGSKPLRDINKKTEESDKVLSEKEVPSMSSGYFKEDGTLDPSLFIIVSGGTVRERDYFKFIENRSQHFPRIIIEFFDTDKNGTSGLDVNNLVVLATEIKEEKEKGKGEDLIDNINIVTDVDHFMPQLITNVPICKTENINLIISNPCFEIWLYYGHENELPNDFTIPSNPLKISSAFKTYLGNKVKGGVKTTKELLNIENAIINSNSNYSEDKNAVPILFSTQMHLLAKKISDLIGDDLTKYLEFEEDRVDKMKKEQLARKLNKLSHKQTTELKNLLDKDKESL